MMRLFVRLVAGICLFVCLVVSAFAVVDLHEFDTASQRERYHQLSEELRCPKCQNQNLAGSDSQIAGDLRRELHRLLLEGKTDREIKSYMVDRYGEFVLYKPRFQKATLVLWVLPIVLFVMGVFVLNVVVSRRKAQKVQAQDAVSEKNQVDQPSAPLSDQETSTLNQLLSDTDDKGSSTNTSPDTDR